MDPKEKLRYLQAISKEPTTCTLVTKEGERTEVEPFPQTTMHLFSLSEI